jgi:hypothetical protein
MKCTLSAALRKAFIDIGLRNIEMDKSPINGEEAVVCLDDFEREAVKVLPKNAFDYFRSGADDEATLRDNIDAFKRSVK